MTCLVFFRIPSGFLLGTGLVPGLEDLRENRLKWIPPHLHHKKNNCCMLLPLDKEPAVCCFHLKRNLFSYFLFLEGSSNWPLSRRPQIQLQ